MLYTCTRLGAYELVYFLLPFLYSLFPRPRGRGGEEKEEKGEERGEEREEETAKFHFLP